VVSRISFTVIAALVAGTAPAGAHAMLEHASPPVGGQVAASPATIDLSFTEAVVPHFSHVEVLEPSGKAVHTGPPHSAKNGRDLIVSLPPLPPGQYTVAWRVTSQDTHKTEGRFRFAVAR
jgi:methionine-rich copper-binding protein CopC